MSVRRYRIDADVRRHGNVVVGGSPLKLFRLTDAGRQAVDRVVAGDAVDESPLIDSLLDAGAIHPANGSTGSTGRYSSADVTIVVPVLGAPTHCPSGAIVVDDGSDPPVRGADVRHDVTRGPGAARNSGLAVVTTPLVAFVDVDVRLPDDWLSGLLPHFDDDRVGLVAPRVASAPGPTGVARYEVAHSPLDLGDRPARVRAGTRVGYVPAAAIVGRVAAIRELGGFDESLRYGEDVDLVWRLDDAGWRVRYEPAVVVHHDARPTWASWWRQRVGYGSSAAPLARRHPGALAPVRSSAWSIAAWIAAVGVHPAAGAAISGGSAAALVRKLRDIPSEDAFGLAWHGNLRVGGQLASAVRRVWWPLLVVAGVSSRRARRVLVLSAIASRHPIRLADDVAYSIGVWRGVLAERTVGPLVPDISSWPGRRSTPTTLRT